MSRRRVRNLSISSDYEHNSAPKKKKTAHTPLVDDFEIQSQSSSKSGEHSQLEFPNNLSLEGTIPRSINYKDISERCGKVSSMRLQNFMCHENLFIEFGPNINFLVGSNGSGKSAILTALVLGLGNSARATNRASSIQKLIKNGETSATIEVTLCNSGLRPFKSDIYGPRISVVRQIRQSSSQYQLKDSRGNTVSKKLDDIRRMLVFFGIQVDNPIFVLNQDTARQFLKDLEPSSNYALVMKGTQLDLCSSSLNQSYQRRVKMVHEMELLKDKKDQTQKLCNIEEDKLKMLQNKESIMTRLEKAKAELAWAAVKQYERELSGYIAKIDAIELKKAELIECTSRKDCQQQALSHQLSKLDEKKAPLFVLYKKQENVTNSAKLRVQECNQKLFDINISIKNAQRRMEEDQKILASCQKHLENYNVDYAKHKRLKESHAALLGTLNKKMISNEEIIRQLRKEQQELTAKALEIQEQSENAKKDLRRLEQRDHHLKLEINSLISNKSNQMSVYGHQAIAAQNHIRREFNSEGMNNMPLGPLGTYISVPNPKYRDLVENELSGVLRSYIVNSDADRRKLSHIFQKVYTHGKIPSIILSPYSDRVYDVSNHKVKPIPNTRLLMDEIRCENPIVMNYLIDVCRIETILITESKEIAEYLTSELENVPPNLSRVLVPNLLLEYSPAPNYAMYSLNLKSACILQVNVDERIKALEGDAADLKNNILNSQRIYKSTNEQITSFNREIEAKASLINQRSTENKETLRKIMEIEQYEYEELPEQDHLQRTMDNISNKICEGKKQNERLQAELVDISKDKALAENEEAEQRAKINPLQENIASVEKEYTEIECKIRSLDTHYDANFCKLNKTIELLENFIKQKGNIERELQEARNKAQQKGDYSETEQSEQEIRDKISRYESKIKQYKSLNFTIEEVEKQLHHLKSSLRLQIENLRIAYQAAKILRMCYHQRAQRFQRSRHHYFTMVEFQFQQALNLREFSSAIHVNHKSHTFQIDVQPPSGNKTSNSKTLSGGERSFTTVSLLKGLWSTSDHPFYFLDEYDVFTDEVNRTFITQILIDEGNAYQNRQFCFLTPQDTEVAASHLITVHKLDPPVR
ncbi:structural maintenance of chromosomes protein 6 isoform X2 [Scaptodrosophila lebanonensis]|nr:structural maintenance of chromosomes protein 6 isoform X2 [Scaptodrosophila lebanonensis]